MFGLRDDNKAKESRYKEILELVPIKIRHSVDGIIKKLFPRLESNMNYSGDWDETWRNEKRICAEERFDFYFQLGIPDGAISETEINSLLQTLDDGDNFTKNLVNFSEPNRIRPLLSKINDKIKTLSIEQIKILITSLWNLEKTIDDERVGVFDLDDVSTKVMRLGYQSFKQVIPDNQRKDVLSELLNTSKTLFYPLQLVSVLSEEVKESKQREESTRTSLISEESSELLKAQSLDKIKKASEDGLLLSEKNLPYILYRWRDWGGEDAVKGYIREVITDKGLLVKLLEKFVSNVLSTAGNYKHLDKKSIGGLYNIEEIEKLVLAITENEVNNFTEQQKEAINLFKNPKKDSVFN
jgi:predicted KAP-like P-loop ATPase